MRRGVLTDAAWLVIEPLLPKPGTARSRWRDHRQVINGILWKLRTGAPWRDLPERFGPWKTCHERLRRWTADGTWDKILASVIVHDDGQPVEWVISVDSSVVRAHQHSAGARKKKGGSTGSSPPALTGEAIGRSRGGLSTKIHLTADGRGRPLSILITPGQAGDNPWLFPLLEAIAVPTGKPGWPRRRPDPLLADKGYAHNTTRRRLRRPGIRHVIPERADTINRRTAKGSRGGRPPHFDKHAHKQRNVVERAFNRLKQWRDPATRYTKRASINQASLTIPAITIQLP